MVPVELVEVESSNVQAIGYDADTKRLFVQFWKSGLYQYENVPEAVYNAFLQASSKGKFVWQQIRDHYGFIKIG